MKKALSRGSKVLWSLGLVALIVAVGVITNPAEARPGPPGPLCGWTAQWDCTLRNGNHVTIVGTQCDILEFEQQTGATCVPI